MTDGPGDGVGGGVPGPFGQDPLSELMRQLQEGGLDPAALSQLGLGDPAQLQQMMAQVQAMMATAGDGPVNWTLATDVARRTAAAAGDASVGAADRRRTVEALRLAGLWLDAVTDIPAAGTSEYAWSRAEWIEATLPVWRRLAEPVADSVATAMADVMAEQAPPELRPMLAQAGTMMRQVGGTVFGMQVGQAVGGLAGEVVSAYDIGLPLVPAGTTALLPANVAAFGDGLAVPPDEVRLYLALREAAHARLFAHAAWLGPHLLAAVEAFARGISIDTSAIEEAVARVDPTDPNALQEALAGGMFEPQRTPAQQAALDRLETTLALVEGWVDEVTDAAAGEQLPHAAQMRESVRRRRAVGGPAEHTLANLVGLELRPRRLREAAALWGAMAARHGAGGRDTVWLHPDLVPGAADLDDPLAFAERWGATTADDSAMDAALEELLSGPPPAAGAADGPAGSAGDATGDSAGAGDGDGAGGSKGDSAGAGGGSTGDGGGVDGPGDQPSR